VTDTAPVQMIVVRGHTAFTHEVMDPQAVAVLLDQQAPLLDEPIIVASCTTAYPAAQCACGHFLITWDGDKPQPGGPSWL